MRDYAKVSPQFWHGKTGKALKAKGPEAVIVALYLLTCQHANMLGLYYLAPSYIAVDTGLGMEGALKGLAGASEALFCRYDELTEIVWVPEMAAYQVGEQLDPKDKQCIGIQRQYDALPENPFLTAFYERYAQAFCMTSCRGKPAPKQKGLQRASKAPSKPGTGTGTGTGVDATASRLPADWVLPQEWEEWARAERPDLDPTTVAYGFRDHWIAKPGKDGRKLDWQATWRNWIRNQRGVIPIKRTADPFAGAA